MHWGRAASSYLAWAGVKGQADVLPLVAVENNHFVFLWRRLLAVGLLSSVGKQKSCFGGPRSLELLCEGRIGNLSLGILSPEPDLLGGYLHILP